MEEKEPIETKFQITDVSNKCIRHIKKTTETTTLIYHAIQSLSETDNLILDVDALAIGFNDPEEVSSEVSLKERAVIWLFKKSFEEFIVGVTESLIEAHKAINLQAGLQIKFDEISSNFRQAANLN